MQKNYFKLNFHNKNKIEIISIINKKFLKQLLINKKRKRKI